ncbi:MAG: hypothetical protein IJQ82_02405 [Selenomonadaceae bacterium]|nr:hypothetical protein [Selenomonadaceae bacterium]
MLDINEIENALREATNAAHEEYLATAEAWLANPTDPAVILADRIATDKQLALQDALDIITQISWHSDETAEQIVARIVKEITFKVEYTAKKLWEIDEAQAS